MMIQTQNLGKTSVDELASSMGKIIPTANSLGVQLDVLCGSYAVMTANGIATAETTTYMNSMLNGSVLHQRCCSSDLSPCLPSGICSTGEQSCSRGIYADLNGSRYIDNSTECVWTGSKRDTDLICSVPSFRAFAADVPFLPSSFNMLFI